MRLAKLSQEYEESRAERNSEIQRLRDELAVAREGAQTAETQLAEFRTALSRVDALQEQVKLSEVRVQQLKIEKQKTEASLEMAQEDNLLLLDQVKAYAMRGGSFSPSLSDS